jgi:hypothetical protein
MTTNLPFLHPAQDPPVETTARARSRVERTLHRRRAQRRAAVLATFAVVATVGTVRVFSHDNSGDAVVAQGDASDRAKTEVDPDIEWSDPILSKDGRTMTIMVGSAPPGDGPCDQNFKHEVTETERSVTVRFEKLPSPRLGEGEACAEMLRPQRFDIALGAPLGHRAVYDGLRPEPQKVHRLDQLVRVTTVPSGWSADEPAIAGAEENGWQQAFHKDGADWYFAVNQQPTPDATTPEGTPTPVTVHGIDALRYTGQMNNTMETIVWTEQNITISVWGEMQGPPTFTRSDQLLQIADSVRLPTTN